MIEAFTREFEIFKRELLLAPLKVRAKFLERIESFLAALDLSKSYPFDFIFFNITTHRPESVESPPIPAENAAIALARILDEVGRTVRAPVESVTERVLTVEDLSQRWNVSPATVLRWRNQGLASRFFVFDGGRRKVGVRESLARRFEADRARLLRRARSRRRIGTAERRAIIEAGLVGLAREIPPARIVADLSERFLLTQAKVQRLILAAARENPALLPLTRARISRRERECIFREVRAGATLEDVSRRWGRSVEKVKKICLSGRAKALARRRIKFIASDEFADAETIARIIANRIPKRPSTEKIAPASQLPVYLKGIAGSPLLEREEEAALFRRYNGLKFAAAKLRSRLDPRKPSESLMNCVDSLLAQADKVRERIIRANLRLVVAIARRHHGRRTDFQSLVSDGNVGLLDAVEAFDYARGNRFSTYAGWAIMRRFARTVPEDNYRVTSVAEEILENTAQVEVDYTAVKPAVVAGGIAHALKGLSERERFVIESRFALGGREKPKTLQELGNAFGVTKERVRQIEVQALGRLRAIISKTTPELAPV
ncbi:MAG: sigma-70 family RNA polymerase sigma factor [Planctomycetota bacterium]|jgi:RNA polymerase sigma factor (sigma-70 family)